MSKTVSELAQELGLSKQYLNRILSQNNLGRKKGNKKVVSDIDEKALISILESNIGNKKSETKTETKSEIEMETSFRYVREQLEIKGKEVERLHQLLDQSQQLLLNEQKKNQLLLESKAEPADWEEEKTRLKKEISSYQKSLSEANRVADNNYAYAVEREQWFWIAGITAVVFLVIILVLIWIHFF